MRENFTPPKLNFFEVWDKSNNRYERKKSKGLFMEIIPWTLTTTTTTPTHNFLPCSFVYTPFASMNNTSSHITNWFSFHTHFPLSKTWNKISSTPQSFPWPFLELSFLIQWELWKSLFSINGLFILHQPMGINHDFRPFNGV